MTLSKRHWGRHSLIMMIILQSSVSLGSRCMLPFYSSIFTYCSSLSESGGRMGGGRGESLSWLVVADINTL